jgi:adenosylhomocysteine/aminodeoxyfutalosine nucleosidase
MKIGILGAMKEEIKPILSKLDSYDEVKYANNVFYLGKYLNHDLVIAYSKIGKVFSSMTVTLMIEKFDCKKILFSGVAGGVNSKLKIGEMVIGTKLCQHDFDLTAFGREPGYVSDYGIYSKSDDNLIDLAKKVCKKQEIEVIDGVIATGDQFISNSEKKDWIRKTFSADALEMEGASVALVCDTLNVPFLVIRSISDTAGEDAHISFEEFLEISAENSSKLIFGILDELN